MLPSRLTNKKLSLRWEHFTCKKIHSGQQNALRAQCKYSIMLKTHCEENGYEYCNNN